MKKPIPAYYCCYLLRSIPARSTFYIGSTPHPKRRLDQHNGVTQGGAKQTSRNSCQPWAMVCLVSGFPSKVAALQFEWAWQHPNITRHIPELSRPELVVMRRTRTGRMVPSLKSKRPQLNTAMESLHLLLRSPSFSNLPLSVTILDESVARAWQRRDLQKPKLPHGISVATTFASKDLTRAADVIRQIDATYRPILTATQRSQALFSQNCASSCQHCKIPVQPIRDLLIRCSSLKCNAVWHLRCLAQAVEPQRSAVLEPGSRILPSTSHECPSCNSSIQWPDLVKDLSLRIRGKQILTALSKIRSRAKIDDSDAEIAEKEELLLSCMVDDVEDSPKESAGEEDTDEISEQIHSSYLELDDILKPVPLYECNDAG